MKRRRVCTYGDCTTTALDGRDQCGQHLVSPPGADAPPSWGLPIGERLRREDPALHARLVEQDEAIRARLRSNRGAA